MTELRQHAKMINVQNNINVLETGQSRYDQVNLTRKIETRLMQPSECNQVNLTK